MSEDIRTGNGSAGLSPGTGICPIIALIVLLLAALLAFAMPRQLPALQGIQPRAHAAERHGTDAEVARQGLLECGDGLRARLCPPSSRHGLSVVFWCESSGSLCLGMYATIGGAEKTCFIRPCADWRDCR